MKTVYAALLAAAAVVAAPVHADEALAKAKGCLNCHDAAAQKIGPSYKDVAAKYKGDKNAVATLAASIKGGTGAGKGWQKAGKAQMPSMPPNAVSDDEAKKLATWVMSAK